MMSVVDISTLASQVTGSSTLALMTPFTVTERASCLGSELSAPVNPWSLAVLSSFLNGTGKDTSFFTSFYFEDLTDYDL